MTLEDWQRQYDIQESEIKPLIKSTNGKRTALKELIGEKRAAEACKRYFKDFKSIKKVATKQEQLDGIDYIVTLKDKSKVNIDLKSCVGDYTTEHAGLMKAPLELRQNGYFTNINKKTDYFLYIWHNSDGSVRYAFLKYCFVSEVCKRADHIVCKNRGITPLKFAHYTSNNNSGEYIILNVKAESL